MANCDKIFREFNHRIKLSQSKKRSLRISRDSLRGKVQDKFKEKDYSVRFCWQGSFATNTIITPKDGDYDIDDGIYIQSDTEPDESITTLHRWIVEAAENHTNQSPVDKNPCVRVRFADGHHVDLVLYHFAESAEHPQLAHKRDGWIVSDPREFMDWFNSKCDEAGQLKRVVRYLKAWADDLRGDMPSGLILTILATNNIEFSERDDLAFFETMKNIQGSLNNSFECYRPTTPREDLLSEYSETRKDYFLERLDSFVRSGRQALEEPNQKDACPKWKRHFGDRFPCEMAEDELDDAKFFESPAFIRSDARSA
jgi:hypothetical protein